VNCLQRKHAEGGRQRWVISSIIDALPRAAKWVVGFSVLSALCGRKQWVPNGLPIGLVHFSGIVYGDPGMSCLLHKCGQRDVSQSPIQTLNGRPPISVWISSRPFLVLFFGAVLRWIPVKVTDVKSFVSSVVELIFGGVLRVESVSQIEL